MVIRFTFETGLKVILSPDDPRIVGHFTWSKPGVLSRLISPDGQDLRDILMGYYGDKGGYLCDIEEVHFNED